MSNSYTHQAKKTQVNGHWYDSRLEARVATLLHKHKVKFTPHVKFEVFGRDGRRFFYEVDFLLNEPRKFAGIPGIVRALEVKGVLRKKDINRVEALEYCHFIHCWITTEPIIKMWESEGMFWKKSDPK